MTLSVQMANNASKEPTKRETLRQLAKIYDPLGIASPITLQGKIIYRDICDAKLPWDFELNGTLTSDTYNFRNEKLFNIPKYRTNRFRDTFIILN